MRSLIPARQPFRGGAPPFPHGRDEQDFHRVIRAAAYSVEQFFQAAPRPEGILELVRLCAEAAKADALFKDDRPTPERGHDQNHHDRLDQDIRLEEQAPKGKVGHGHGTGQRHGINCLIFHSSTYLASQTISDRAARTVDGRRRGRPLRPIQASRTLARTRASSPRWMSCSISMLAPPSFSMRVRT